MDLNTVKTRLAQILRDLIDFHTRMEDCDNPDLGDRWIDAHNGDTLERLYPLEAAAPEDYLSALRFFGPQAIFQLMVSIAGKRELEAFPKLRAACVRMERPEMSQEAAERLLDPQNPSEDRLRMDSHNLQNDILRPWIARFEEHFFTDTQKAPADFPDSGDRMMLWTALGQVSYGFHPGNPDLFSNRAADLIEEGVRLSDSTPTPDRALRLRIGTLLGAGSRAVTGCGYDIFEEEKSAALSVSDLLKNSAQHMKILFLSPVTGFEDFLKYAHEENGDPRYLSYIKEIGNRSQTLPPFEYAQASLSVIEKLFGEETSKSVGKNLDRSFIDLANRLEDLASRVDLKASTDPIFRHPIPEVRKLCQEQLADRVRATLSPAPLLSTAQSLPALGL